MKRMICLALIIMLTGCVTSWQNTINRLQSDMEYFEEELQRYSMLLNERENTEAEKVLLDAKLLLDNAEKAMQAGDKIKEKKYLSALVDIMEILQAYEKRKE